MLALHCSPIGHDNIFLLPSLVSSWYIAILFVATCPLPLLTFFLYGHIYWHAYCSVNCMYTYIHKAIFQSCSLHGCGMTANLLYTIQDPVCTNSCTLLVYTQHDALQMLGQYCNILTDHDHK